MKKKLLKNPEPVKNKVSDIPFSQEQYDKLMLGFVQQPLFSKNWEKEEIIMFSIQLLMKI